MALIILIGIFAIVVGGFLVAIQLISCSYCPFKDKCSNIIKNGGEPPCQNNPKNYSL